MHSLPLVHTKRAKTLLCARAPMMTSTMHGPCCCSRRRRPPPPPPPLRPPPRPPPQPASASSTSGFVTWPCSVSDACPASARALTLTPTLTLLLARPPASPSVFAAYHVTLPRPPCRAHHVSDSALAPPDAPSRTNTATTHDATNCNRSHSPCSNLISAFDYIRSSQMKCSFFFDGPEHKP